MRSASTLGMWQQSGLGFDESDGTFMSQALHLRLRSVELLNIEVILRVRGVRTLQSLERMDERERLGLVKQAKQLWLLLELIPAERLVEAFESLFSSFSTGLEHTAPTYLPTFPFGQTNSGAMLFQPVMPGPITGSSSSSNQQVDPVQSVQAVADYVPIQYELPAVGDDESVVVRNLSRSIAAARQLLGEVTHTEVISRLDLSNIAAVRSLAEAALAYSATKTLVERHYPVQEEWNTIKAAKLAIRDLLVWRCGGMVCGLDSQAASGRAFQVATQAAYCDENCMSQLQMGTVKVRAEMHTNPPIHAANRPTKRGGNRHGSHNGSWVPISRSDESSIPVPTSMSDESSIPVPTPKSDESMTCTQGTHQLSGEPGFSLDPEAHETPSTSEAEVVEIEVSFDGMTPMYTSVLQQLSTLAHP